MPAQETQTVFVLRTFPNRKYHLSIIGKNRSLCGKARDYDNEGNITLEQFNNQRIVFDKCI